MIAQIIPLKKIPRHLESFDYQIPKELIKKIKAGCLVKISWRNQVIFGLVKKISQHPVKQGLNLKTIISLSSEQMMATPKQFALIKKLSKKLLLSPSLWWKMIIPIPPKKITKFKPWLQENKLGLNNIQPKKLNIKKNKEKYHLIIPNDYQEMINTVLQLVKKPGKHLILCPEISHIEKIISFLPKNYLPSISVLHKKLNKTEYWQNYLKIVKCKDRLIFGTRLAALGPFKKLSSIIVFKSEDYSFKQADQNPRFWLHDIVYEWQNLLNTNIYLLSLSPRIETYAYIKSKHGNIYAKQKPLNLSLVDMSQEYRINNYTQISWLLENNINQTLLNKQKVFLLINRKGLARKIICRDCGWIGKCPDCQNLLNINDKGLAWCRACFKNYKIPDQCPKCKNINIAGHGITNQSIVSKLKQIFPQIKIQYIDAQHPQLLKSSQIIVGTQFAYQKINHDFGLVGFLAADEEFSPNDFHSDEYAWQLFNYLSRFLPNLNVVIQTWQKEYWIYQNLSSGSYDKFWQKEMLFRKRFKYPPYAKLIKCSTSHLYKNKDETNIESTYKFLKQNLPSAVEVSKIFKSSYKINNKYNFFIILKYTTQDIMDILKQLPADIILDFNPYSVF